MRTFTGYFFILLMFPIFIFLTISVTNETKQVQSLQEVVDEKIHIEDKTLTQTSYMKDRNGKVVSELYGPTHRIYLKSDKIPVFVKDLFILSEDKHFYEHQGFDLSAMARALATNVQANTIEQGASTITQQLARNLYLNYEKSYNRKLSELIYAYELERKYSKEEILEMYINVIYFQHGAYGIEAAADQYFQKPTSKLSKAELAFLAAIPNNPTFYDPVKHFKRTKKRQERLINQLSEQGSLSQEEARKIQKQPIKLSLKEKVDLYPDYTTYVEVELKNLIAQQEGYKSKLKKAKGAEKEKIQKQLKKRVSEVIDSGIIIETALNPTLQNRSIQAIQRYLPYYGVEGSAAVIDHQNHELLALVGGKNYKKYDFHRGFQAFRQPGSSIKPLLVYAPYFERTNAGIYNRVSAAAFCSNGYCPQNYGGATYGNVTLQSAFIHSFNTPAVRLLNTIGVENGFSDLKKFRFERIVSEDHRLAAAIGGFTYGMTPLELTGAYTTFANGGNYQPPHAIRKVTDLNGKVLYKWKEKPKRVWSEATVDKMRFLMNKTITSGTARKAYIQAPYAGGKTGTTNDYKDYWFVGLTDKLTAGVWVGKDQPATIKSIESAAPHLYIWKQIVSGY